MTRTEQALARKHRIRFYKQGDRVLLVLGADMDGMEAGTLLATGPSIDALEPLRREFAVGMTPLPDVALVI